MTLRRWKHTAPNTTAWHGRLQAGRITIGWHIYKHHSSLPDRWVLQPTLIYDRKSGA